MKLNKKTVLIKAILFDLDGVLVDTYHLWYKLFNQTLKHFGYEPITLKTFAQNWGKSTEEDVRIFMSDVKLKNVVKYISKNFLGFIKHMKTNPEAKITLNRLKRMGLKIGCVTNSHRDITAFEIEKSGLKKYFDVVVTADDVKKPKPAPDMLLKACRKLKVRIEEIVFIGDTQTDRLTGEKIRCIFIGFRMETALKIKNLSELITLIKNKFSI